MVFTGIVEEMGTVVSLTEHSNMLLWDGSHGTGWVLTVNADITLSPESMYIGVSIAVNGTCLTATEYDLESVPRVCSFGLSPETLRRTNLERLKPAEKVNMERSMKADSRNSGHFVQGHVDGTGTIIKKWVEGDSLWIRVQTPPEITKYLVPKYIANFYDIDLYLYCIIVQDQIMYPSILSDFSFDDGDGSPASR